MITRENVERLLVVWKLSSREDPRGSRGVWLGMVSFCRMMSPEQVAYFPGGLRVTDVKDGGDAAEVVVSLSSFTIHSLRLEWS